MGKKGAFTLPQEDAKAAVGNAMAAGFAAGGINGGNIQSALQGAFCAAAFFGVGELFSTAAVQGALGGAAGAAKVAAHAAVGCGMSAAAGGSCRSGAMSAGFAEAAGGLPGMPKDFFGGMIARAVIGGIASKLGGGKFANGAVTAAFGYVFYPACTAVSAPASSSSSCMTGGRGPKLAR